MGASCLVSYHHHRALMSTKTVQVEEPYSFELKSLPRSASASTKPATTAPSLSSTVTPANEDQRKEEAIALPPVDGGIQAWRFVLCAFIIETLVWGFPLRSVVPLVAVLSCSYSRHSEQLWRVPGMVPLVSRFTLPRCERIGRERYRDGHARHTVYGRTCCHIHHSKVATLDKDDDVRRSARVRWRSDNVELCNAGLASYCAARRSVRHRWRLVVYARRRLGRVSITPCASRYV